MRRTLVGGHRTGWNVGTEPAPERFSSSTIPPDVAKALTNGEPAPTHLTAEERAAFDQTTALTVFPGEIYQVPRSWAERAYHQLIYYHRVDKGCHFAAWEEPQLFSAESSTSGAAGSGRVHCLSAGMRWVCVAHSPWAGNRELHQCWRTSPEAGCIRRTCSWVLR